MKRQVLFMAMVLIGLTSATATTAGDAVLIGEDYNTARNRYAQPILFVERGVEFLVFADGSFDFNTELFTTAPNDNNYYYRRSNTRTRRSTNRTYGAPGTTYNVNDRGVLIRHDNEGRVRRIGNVFINYDRQGRLKRVGSVYLGYRGHQLVQVGGLRILTNRHGEVIGTRGFVNFNNQNCGICGITGCSVDHFDDSNHNNWNEDDWNNNDDDYYYYRKGGKTLKQKKIKF
ncbi:hypothetical protein [Winogradskyella forsetii]|uniref:hypothetical protein n=1 Tax=Winogradskyella forsetii TaxID=2686077 RepID=UPI0015C0A963|nr:hypothetical protein [Winogradskyella forsetii]